MTTKEMLIEVIDNGGMYMIPNDVIYVGLNENGSVCTFNMSGKEASYFIITG